MANEGSMKHVAREADVRSGSGENGPEVRSRGHGTPGSRRTRPAVVWVHGGLGSRWSGFTVVWVHGGLGSRRSGFTAVWVHGGPGVHLGPGVHGGPWVHGGPGSRRTGPVA